MQPLTAEKERFLLITVGQFGKEILVQARMNVCQQN